MFIINENNSIEIIRGDTGEFKIFLSDAFGKEYQLQDGDKIYFTVKKSVKDSNILIQKEGKSIKIEPEDTSSLDFGKYVYDIQVTLADGTVDTVVKPTTFTVLSEVTC